MNDNYMKTILSGVKEWTENLTDDAVDKANGTHKDWNENDPTQPGYIENRPFYTGDPVETVLVEESTVSFVDSNHGFYVAEFRSTFEATAGEVYKVSWDGTVYECTCVNFSGEAIIGNLSIAGAGSDTGEPFLMIIMNGTGIRIVTTDTSASHTFSISGFAAPEVVKIDEKYLPESAFTNAEWSKISNKIVDCKKQSLSLSVSGESITIGTGSTHSDNIINDKLKFEDGMSYEINGSIIFYDSKDQVYTLDVNGYYICSNGEINFGTFYDKYYREDVEISLNSSSSDDNKYYYGRLAAFAVFSPHNEAYTFDINITVTEEVKPLPDICIGKNIQRVGDEVIIASSTAGSTKKFKITVDDSGAITATEIGAES